MASQPRFWYEALPTSKNEDAEPDFLGGVWCFTELMGE
jgi:hypothetical protein